MDIKIKNDLINYKFRVSACIVKNDKILCVQIMDNGFYCLPGGHVKLGESSLMAVKREVNEEVNLVLNDYYIEDEPRLIGINETIFNQKENKKVHETTFIYNINIKTMDKIEDKIVYENDEGLQKKLEFKWINIKDLKNSNFKPNVIINQIENKDYSFKHYIDGFNCIDD